MPKKFRKYITVAALSLALLFSCKGEKEATDTDCLQNDLLAKKSLIVYEQEMIVPEEYFFFKSIDFLDFLKTLREKAMKKTIVAYQPFSDIVCSDEDVEQKFNAEFNPDELKSLIFEEEWVLDSARFIMKKKVNSYALVRNYVRHDAYRGLMQIKSPVAKFDFSAAGFRSADEAGMRLLAKDVAYEVALTNDDNPDFLEDFQVKQLAKILVEKALGGNTEAYSFSFRDSLILRSHDEVAQLLGQEVICYEEIDETTGDIDTICFDRQIDIKEICGVAFIEDWYVDTKTMEILKEVKGIAPVRAFYNETNDDTQSDLVKTIPFVMYLKNHDKGK